MGIFNADIIINIPPAFFSLQKSGLVRVYLTSVFLLLSVPRCFGDPKPQFDFFFLGEGILGEGILDYFFFWERGCFVWDFWDYFFFWERGCFVWEFQFLKE